MIAIITGCSSDPAGNNSGGSMTKPLIVSLTAKKTQILYGGQDPAIITCVATGGNLKYKWQVDLGDIIPLNADNSKISFNGAACCVGVKVINCTVSNDSGSVTKSIEIEILEVIKEPEIISIQSDNTDIIVGQTTDIVCNALGGHLNYLWEADCGDIVLNLKDSTKISYTGSAACKGNRTIKCTVSNEKGTIKDSININVK